MLSKDTFWVGLAVGTLTPIMLFIALIEINTMLIENYFRGGAGLSEQFRAIISVCVNILPFIIYNRTRKDNAMRGIMLPTFIYAVVILFYYFGSELF